MPLSRRDFLKLMTASSVGSVAFTGCQAFGIPPHIESREFEVQSPVRNPEDLVTGVDNWYATICPFCEAGCGVIVRVLTGRAKKVEGNPDFPVNKGKVCARGQTLVQDLYHPDRLRGPMKLDGDRGSGRFKDISWDDALTELVGRLKDLGSSGRAGSLLMVTREPLGHRAQVVDTFVSAYGGRHMTLGPEADLAVRSATSQFLGSQAFPQFDIENAQFVLSFGADFLGTWISPVHYSLAYGEFRQGPQRQKRGTLVQIEPRMSLTAANADRWVPIKPGTEGLLALSLAQVIVAEGLGDKNAAAALLGTVGAGALDAFKPDKLADATGVPADRISQLAQDFAKSSPALAIVGGPAAGQTNGFFTVNAVLLLNYLVGSVGKAGGVLQNPDSLLKRPPQPATPTSYADWQKLADDLKRDAAGTVGLFMVHGANPVYGLPAALGLADTLPKIPYIVSFSSYLDETTTLADLILPSHVALEDWGDVVPDPVPGVQVLGLQQPVVRPLYNTRGFIDVLLTVAEDLGGEVHRALPWNTTRDVLRDAVGALPKTGGNIAATGDFESFWTELLAKGGWWQTSAGAPSGLPAKTPTLPTQAVAPQFAGDQQDFPFGLIVYPSNTVGDGSVAHLPWLQGLPDPLTSVTWHAWLEVNPKTAEQLGLAENDIVTVESPNGSVDVPVYPFPGIRPDVVAIPTGRGHSNYTRYANNGGVNPLSILAPLADQETGALATAATRVRLRKTGRRFWLPKTEGVVPARQLEDEKVYLVTSEGT